MKHSLPPLDSLKVFEAAARHLSFSLAADELCISKGAVSYQIRKLESSIRQPLFKREVRQIYLTDAGQDLYQTTKQLFNDLSETLAKLDTKYNAHHVTIGATTYVAARWLSSRIARFNERYPDVAVVFQHSVNSSGFRLQDVDLVMRWCACDEAIADKSQKLLPMPLYPVCSPALLKRVGISLDDLPLDETALSTEPLNRLTLLAEDQAQNIDLWQAWYTTTGKPLENQQLVISDANVRVQSAIDGQGLIMADELMRTELDNGLLIAPFKHQLSGYGYALWLGAAQEGGNATSLYEWLIRPE